MSKNLLEEAALYLGINRATLERVAHDLEHQNPELRKIFDKNIQNKSLDNVISELEEQLKEVLNHVKSPDVGGSGGTS
jgi:hypothetical protein